MIQIMHTQITQSTHKANTPCTLHIVHSQTTYYKQNTAHKTDTTHAYTLHTQTSCTYTQHYTQGLCPDQVKLSHGAGQGAEFWASRSSPTMIKSWLTSDDQS